MHILLTRPLEDCSEMIIKFKSLGNQVSHLPLLKIDKINHYETCQMASAERNVLKVLEGDCETAVGVHAIIQSNKIILEAELFSLDGTRRFYEKKSSEIEKAKELGKEVGQTLKIKSKNTYKKK